MSAQTARVLVLGAAGMLGQDMVRVLADAGWEVVAADRARVDILDRASVRAAAHGVQVVVNCAAYTDVDGAESDERAARAVNATGPELIAGVCRDLGIRMVHVSTDYVFDGEGTAPYPEDHETSPLGAYGRTKAEGERAVLDSGADALVVRTAWLYGAGGGCFPRTIARLARERGRVSVVDDQRGQPTWTVDLATFVTGLLAASVPAGIYHGTASGACSWFEFALAVVRAAGIDAEVTPARSAEFPRPAARPAWSVLGHNVHRRLGVASIGAWDARWAVAAPQVLAPR